MAAAVDYCAVLHRYKAVAAVFRAIFAQYDPNFESASLDEAYLDITAHLAAKQAQQPTEQPWDRDIEAAAVAAAIRQRVFEATQLTCSAGIACNRMLAKIATDVNKPNGQHLVPSNLPAILSFISPLPVRQVPGIGKVLERTLNAIGVQTVGQMRDDEYRALVVDCFSELTYGWLFRISLGLGRVEHEGENERRRKSVSTEQTFRDISTYAELTSKADDIARSLYGDIERLGVKGRTLTLKLKTAAFEVKQRGVSVEKGLWIHRLEDVRRLALQLLKDELNLLLAGKKVKRAAEEKLVELTSAGRTGTATGVALSEAAGRVAVGSPFDGLMRIRLMGLRLSALFVDETGEADEESVADGGEQAVSGSVRKRGGMSILKFAKRLDDADQEAIVDEERAEQQSSKRRKAEPDNADISRYFDVVSPSKPHTHLSSAEATEAVDSRGRGSRRSIESYFSHSVAAGVADGATRVEEADEVVEDDDEADEWMELLHDAAKANADDQAADRESPLLSSAAHTATSGSPLLSATASSSTPPAPTAAAPAPVSCPVCGRVLYDSEHRPISNLALNKHIDLCLRNTSQSVALYDLHKPSTTQPSSHTGTRRVATLTGSGRGRRGKRGSVIGRPVSLVDMWKPKD